MVRRVVGADVPADRPAVADLHVGDLRSDLADDRAGARLGALDQVGDRGHRADVEAAVDAELDPPQILERGEIDDRLGRGGARLHDVDERLSAREDAGALVRREKLERLRQRGRSGVSDLCRKHEGGSSANGAVVLHDACRLPPDADLQPLWQPLQLRGVTLPNRVMCSATTLQYGRGGLISDRHLAFYRERARGGVGLLFSEQLAASPLSDTAFPRSIRAYDERQVERFPALAAELEPYETRFFAQLVAGGAKGDSTGGLEGWGPLRGPSRVPAPGGEPPLPLDEADLAQLAADHRALGRDREARAASTASRCTARTAGSSASS